MTDNIERTREAEMETACRKAYPESMYGDEAYTLKGAFRVGWSTALAQPAAVKAGQRLTVMATRIEAFSPEAKAAFQPTAGDEMLDEHVDLKRQIAERDERLAEIVRELEDNGARTQALYDVLNNMCVRTATTYPGKTETFAEAIQWMKENVIDNLVRKQSEISRQVHRACTAENELADLRRQLAERDAEIKQIKLPWQPFSTVPHEALDIEALDENGDIDEISWSNQRYCMLGSPQGSRGAGWVSHLCGHLPVDGPFTHWRPLL